MTEHLCPKQNEKAWQWEFCRECWERGTKASQVTFRVGPVSAGHYILDTVKIGSMTTIYVGLRGQTRRIRSSNKVISRSRSLARQVLGGGQAAKQPRGTCRRVAQFWHFLHAWATWITSSLHCTSCEKDTCFSASTFQIQKPSSMKKKINTTSPITLATLPRCFVLAPSALWSPLGFQPQSQH